MSVLSKKKMVREENTVLEEIVRKYPAVYGKAGIPQKRCSKKLLECYSNRVRFGVRIVNKLMNKYRYANFPTIDGFCVVLFSLQS